jgi:hypothetical protein
VQPVLPAQQDHVQPVRIGTQWSAPVQQRAQNLPRGREPDLQRGPVQSGPQLDDGFHPIEREGGSDVEDDMVHGDQQQVIGGGEGEQPHREQRPAVQRERVRRVRSRDPFDLLSPKRLRDPRQIRHRQWNPQPRLDHLPQLAAGVDEDGTQRGVPGDDGVHRLAERRHVQRPGQPQRERHVVDRGTRFQPVEEPQLFLGEGQRRRALGPAGAAQAHGEQFTLLHRQAGDLRRQIRRQVRPQVRRQVRRQGHGVANSSSCRRSLVAASIHRAITLVTWRRLWFRKK